MVKRSLIFHHALIEEIQQKYKNSKQLKEKQLLSRLINGKIIKKYKLQSQLKTTFGISAKQTQCCVSEFMRNKRRKYDNRFTKIKKVVHAFYLQEDVSRYTTGKKETITRKKLKMQKRFLCSNLVTLHEKFVAQEQIKLSYSLFARLRPFWVLIPHVTDRQTCQCKIHENLAFMANKLHAVKVIETENLEILASQIACDENQKSCMYDECSDCKGKCLLCLDYDKNAAVDYWKWTTEVDVIDEKKVQTTVKEKISTNLFDLVNEFDTSLYRFK